MNENIVKGISRLLLPEDKYLGTISFMFLRRCLLKYPYGYIRGYIYRRGVILNALFLMIENY